MPTVLARQNNQASVSSDRNNHYQSSADNMTTPTTPKIVLPRYQRNDPDFAIAWSEIKHESDLPRRMLVGDLRKSSFALTTNGWTAEYEDLPFHARVEKRNESVWFSEGFNGDEKCMCVFPAHAVGSQCIHGYFRKTGIYDDALSEHFKPLNLTYLPYQSEKTAGMQCFFPDGAFTLIVLPLETMEELASSLQDFQASGIPTTGHLKVAMSVVNYLEGKCPLVPTGEFEHLDWMMLQGVLPAGSPLWEGQPGNRAYTSRRLSPVMHLTVAQAYLPRVIRILNDRGLIVPRTSPHKDRMAFLLHTIDAGLSRSISNFTEDKSRRVFLPLHEDRDEAVTEMLDDGLHDEVSMEHFRLQLKEMMSKFEQTRDGLVARMVNIRNTGEES
jgi:hypothetical protein